jgi:hypothetical protein
MDTKKYTPDRMIETHKKIDRINNRLDLCYVLKPNVFVIPYKNKIETEVMFDLEIKNGN